ncbi:MAG: transglutaminase domain-containing protein [Anaerolineales bacterium]|nr:transglutaminase domain-containing protein [Anaerolineales bacterium]
MSARLTSAAPRRTAVEQLAAWLGGAWSRLVTLGVALACVGIALYCAYQARWVAEPGRYADALWYGALCGALLASSRFSGRFAAGYSLSLSLAAAAQGAGEVLPAAADLFARAPADLITDLNVRALLLGDRAGAWVNAILTGGTLRDTGLFISLASLLLWQTAAWLLWSTLRRRAALAAILPLGLTLGLSNQLAGRPNAEYAAFLAAALLLIGHTAFVTAHAEWEKRRVDYTDSISIDWSVVNAILAVALAVPILAAPWVGTPAGWRALSDLFRAARAETADTASRLFGGVNPPRATVGAASARLPDLGQIGQPLPHGNEAVMWVTVSDPDPPPPQAGEPAAAYAGHYWRSRVYAAYTGSGWEPAAPDPAAAPAVAEAGAPPGRRVVTQHFELLVGAGPELFAVNVPVSVTLEAGRDLRLAAFAEPADALVLGDAAAYRVTSWASAAAGRVLSLTPREYPADIAAEYLALPASLPERVRALAARVAGPGATPFAQAERVQDYLRANYAYQLEVPPAPAGQDVVDYFLFDAPGGFCTYYASAMAVLLRAEGVPARVVAGFATGEFDFERRAWRVPASAAHAWVEVYFPGYGWVEFEPTPSQPRPDYGSAAAPEAAEQPTPPPETPTARPAWAWLAAGAGLAAAALWLWARRRAAHKQEPVSGLYWRMRGWLGQQGLRAPASATPDEFLAACAPALTARPTLWAAVRQATRLYAETAYSAHPVPGAAARAAAALWEQARGDRLRLWWARLRRPRSTRGSARP